MKIEFEKQFGKGVDPWHAKAKRYEGFDADKEFVPVSCAENSKLYSTLKNEKPVIDH